MSTDLNENMTSEEISAYAETVAKEVEQERKGDRSDAEVVVNTTDPNETPAETKSGNEPVETESQGDDTSSESEAPDWLSDEVKAEAEAYGISESELSDFANREELNRALRLFDKSALEAGRKAMADSGDDQVRNEKGQFAKKEPEEQQEATPADGRYEIGLDAELFDEDIINEFTRMRDHYESRLQTLESYFSEASASAEEQRFDSLVDSMGHSDLFGSTGKESPKELERRRDLHVAVKAQMIGLEQLGRPAELNDQLVSRVANMVFADELGKKRLKERTKKVTKQSQSRLGGSATKPSPPREDPRDEADRLYRELAGQ